MKNLTLIFSLCLTIWISGCDKFHKYEVGHLPDTPVNLAEFNTEYDDYNSTAPSSGKIIPFCFSTNRDSRGGQFDVIYRPMNVNFNKSSGVLKVTNDYEGWEAYVEYYEPIKKAIDKIKTTGNEFGPNLIIHQGVNEPRFTLLYSSDISGNAQIKFVSNKSNVNFTEPKDVVFLNSDFDDMYPTLASDSSRIYFCSNRQGGSFDFYYVNVNPVIDLEALLSADTLYQVIRESNLSSSFEDKCPFIFGNKMVFTSNRAGGFGGYDLYYSTFENGNWSAPVNFGPKINTEFDEFRPILLDEDVTWTQTMMVFSSNRPGGLGGFDLYFVGIPGK